MITQIMIVHYWLLHSKHFIEFAPLIIVVIGTFFIGHLWLLIYFRRVNMLYISSLISMCLQCSGLWSLNYKRIVPALKHLFSWHQLNLKLLSWKHIKLILSIKRHKFASLRNEETKTNYLHLGSTSSIIMFYLFCLLFFFLVKLGG